ncbi:eCIS core domain-containing protein [Streptomyces sp. bgisy034]|uniref:eCIS core domain-containing protein n=1 Tax=Streptomyces sp. bgisy034 TaxID=3413774 RepID=UPI003EBDFC7A
MSSQTQDGHAEQSAEQRRRKRKERAAKSRAPEPKDIVSGAGQPLDPGVRRDLEERLGHDLSRVRLHTGRDAGQLTELLGADAVAVGQDVFFAEGAFKPGTDEGRRLLAHELLHTVQNPHGLGTLRAGRELGAVSLPQEAIEREAEAAAQSVVAGPRGGGVEQAADVEQGQGTPGWLRYATVDADRRRTEQLDPATVVDRVANTLLRSLRGDPEDRSGRVRLQLARMAPQVQDIVFERLELRLPTPVIDRLLEAVEETEQAGPLPSDAAGAPLAVPGAAEEVQEERERASAEGRQEDDRRADASRDGNSRQDGRQDQEGDEPAGRQDSGNKDRQERDADPPGGQAPARDRQESAGRQQARSQDRQEERNASGRGAQKDAADERKATADNQKQQTDQDQRDDQQAQEETDGARDEAAAEPEKQSGEQEARQAGAAPRQSAAPAAPDRSGAEPGERPRTGGDTGAARTVGDPEKEESSDDEPLGLDAESTADDAEPDTEPDTDQEASDRRAADADTAPSGEDTQIDPRLFQRRKRGAPRAPELTFSDGPSGGDETPEAAEPATTPDSPARTDEDEAEDRAVQDLMDGMTGDQDSAADSDGPDRAGPSLGAAATSTSVMGKDSAKERSEERQDDAEAARRDEEARAADGTGQDAAPAPGEAAGPDRLAKADEDARTQAAGTPSAAQGASGGASRGESADRTGAEAGDKGRRDTGTAADGGTDQDRQPDQGAQDRAGSAAGQDGKNTDRTQPAPTTPSSGDQDVTEGNGNATTPGPVSGPEKVSTPGPVAAPKLAPGNGPSPMAAGPQARTNAPRATEAPGTGGGTGGSAGSRPRPAGSTRQAARQAAKTARRSGGGGGGGRTASAPAPVRSGGRGGGKSAPAGGAQHKKEAPAPDVSNATPESGLATAGSLKPHQALETLKGVDSAVGRSVDEERSALRKAPPTTQRPSGSPRTVPGGPTPAAPGTYTNAKVARTEAAPGKTPEIAGEQKPEGEVPGVDVPEPSWWDIALTIGAQLFGKLLKEILPLDDLIDSILGLPTEDEGLRKARVGDAPRLPLENDSDPQRTDEQGQKLDERKTELHQAGRTDAGLPMGEDQIYPDVPKETLTGKVSGGKKGAKASGPRSVSGGVPVESASAVAEHDRGPQIQAGFSEGRQKMGQERRAKDKKSTDDRRQYDADLKREVDTSGKKQADARDKGRTDISDSRDQWRKEQDDKVSEIDDKKGKKYDQVRKDIKKKDEDTEKDVDKRTEDDNKKIETEQTTAEQDAEKKQNEGKDDADNWLEEAIEKLKEFFEGLKNAIKGIFEKARQVVTDLIDKFKQQVFKLIDDARNWVIDQINTFADALIALGDELLADYPAMRDKWRRTIDGARDWAVQKVNEFADALKEVAGKLLDGLCGALLAGLDMLETGLLAAVDVAESVTVGALEFGAAAVAALGEWAAIFNDIVSDPGDWISEAGAAAETGAREYLFNEVKTAVRAWFNQKVREIIGIPVEDFQELISGGVTVEQMARMAWDEAVPQLPVIIGVLVVEKVVAKLIPGAGWVMAIIDALQTAWGALSEILAAFGLFMDFLKSVKSGNGALPFAKAVAAGVVALLELVYTFLIEGVGRFMGKVADRLGDLLKKIRTKKDKPGEPDAPGQPSAPNKKKDEKLKEDDPRDKDTDTAGNTDRDKPSDRPAPRKPSPDKMSRPPSKPRPGKRSSPEKKPRPSQTTRPKKRRDDDERREEGREVNAARKRARDAERRTRDDERPARRGPARDTLRKDDRNRDRDRDPRNRHPEDRRTDDHRRDDGKDRGRDRDKGRDGGRRPDGRPRRIRRARQTVKSAANRARRAARKLYGKARRRLGSRLNDRLRRLRDRWRRRKDRMRDDRSRRRDRKKQEPRERDNSDITMPKVRFTDADDGEQHTLMFHGRGARAPLYIHSTPVEIPPFLNSWAGDLGRPEAKRHKSEQEGFLKKARLKYAEVLKEQARPLTETDEKKRKKEKRDKERDLKKAMMKFADEARNRIYFDIPDDELQDFADVSPVGDEDTRRSEEHMSGYIGNPTKTLFGGGGQDARKAADGQPPGWEDLADRGLSAKGAWVRMHLLPESLGGQAKGNNLVPARGEANKEFYRKFEGPAYHAVPDPEPIIWYRTRAEFHKGTPHIASHIYAEYGGYEKIGGTGKEQKDWNRIEAPKDKFERSPLPLDPGDMNKLSINGAGRPAIKKRLLDNKYEALARHFVDARNELHEDEESLSDVGDVEVLMDNYKRNHPTLRLTGLDVLLASLRKKDQEINWNWEF